MRTRRVYFSLVILAVAGVVGLIVAGAFRERDSSEPVSKGRKLSEWLSGYLAEASGDARNQSEAAIRAIGTNAIPSLLEWIRYQEPGWKMKARGAAHGLLSLVNQDWFSTDQKWIRAELAVEAFKTLGPKAEPAIPELCQQINTPYSSTRWRAISSLSFLPLEVLLTNQQNFARLMAIGFMGAGTNAPLFVPELVHSLSDPDPGVRDAASNALRRIDPRALEGVTP